MAANLWHEFSSYPRLLGKLIKTPRNLIQPQRVSFGADKAQYILHFAPPVRQHDTVILYIHGGGWNSGSPALFAFIGQQFALLGYHCLLLGYRKTPAYRYPAQMEDVCAGYQKALDHLAEQGVEAKGIVVTGSSAGAHLGALLCYDTGLQRRFGIDASRLRGFAGLGGVYCFDCRHTFSARRLLKDLFDPHYDRSQGEPYSKLEQGQTLPMLLIHSEWDAVVCRENADMFFQRALSLGIPAQLDPVPYADGNHSAYSAGIFLESRDRCPTLNRLLEWIEQR